MPNALIFSPNFVGHRQVYTYVLSRILNKINFDVFIAGNFSNSIEKLFYIKKLIVDDKIVKIDTNIYPENGLKIGNTDFLALQKKHNIDLTVFVEADCHIPLLISQIFRHHSRFKGRVVGIFLRPWYYYDRYGFIDSLRYIKNLKNTWKSDIDPRFFYKFLNGTFNLLDASLFLDEFVVSESKKRTYIPDVWQQYVDESASEVVTEQRIWIERLAEFKKANKNTFIILYFGTEQKRRGYAELLKLAVDNDVCFVHCGLKNNQEKYDLNVDELREVINKRGKLFETNEYIADTACIDYFFNSVSHIVLPYEDTFYGSSGIMYQSLSYGIPVLVRDTGLLGKLVEKYNLGLTFKGDTLLDQFLKFVNIPKVSFSNSIEKYMKFQSLDRFESTLIQSFNK